MPADRFTVILTHEHTDFDALASMLAAHKLYPHAVPVLPRSLNRNLRDFLALYRSALPFRVQEEMPRRRVDFAIVVDTQTFATVKGMNRNTPGKFIDHHPLQRELQEGWTYAGGETGSTTTLLVEDLAERRVTLTALEATLMLLGIYEDTGSLIYSATSARDLRAAAWLLERGSNLEVVSRFLHHPLTAAQFSLYNQLADNSHVYDINGHTVVIASAHAPDFHDEISTLAHKLRDVYDPDETLPDRRSGRPRSGRRSQQCGRGRCQRRDQAHGRRRSCPSSRGHGACRQLRGGGGPDSTPAARNSAPQPDRGTDHDPRRAS